MKTESRSANQCCSSVVVWLASLFEPFRFHVCSIWLPVSIYLALFGSLWAPFGSLWAPFGSLLASFGTIRASFGSFWLPFGSLSLPFGYLWGAFGSLLAPFGSLLAPFGGPLAPFWLPLGTFRCHSVKPTVLDHFGSKMVTPARAKP